jgi:hypothetical protein
MPTLETIGFIPPKVPTAQVAPFAISTHGKYLRDR